jgi:hypothetical protein
MSLFSDNIHIPALVFLAQHSWEHRRDALCAIVHLRSPKGDAALLQLLFDVRGCPRRR